jgi:hypothetical protein
MSALADQRRAKARGGDEEIEKISRLKFTRWPSKLADIDDSIGKSRWPISSS